VKTMLFLRVVIDNSFGRKTMNSVQLLIQDFQVGQTTTSFEYNGKIYSALLQYNPIKDLRAFLYVYEGSTIPLNKHDYVYHAWISAMAADYSRIIGATSWYISHVVEPDETLRELFIDTMLRLFMTRPKNSSLGSFRVGSPKQLIQQVWLRKYRLVCRNNDEIEIDKSSICPNETPLCSFLSLV
jgi:hypothetical protein